MTTARDLHFVLWRTLACGTLLLAATTGFAQQPLPATEMRKLLSDHTTFGIAETGVRFHVYYRPDGKMFGESRGRYYDVGTWNVADDGKYCRQWSKWRDGARDCFEMYDLGEGKYRFLSIDRRYDTRVQILEGDPHRLQATAR